MTVTEVRLPPLTASQNGSNNVVSPAAGGIMRAAAASPSQKRRGLWRLVSYGSHLWCHIYISWLILSGVCGGRNVENDMERLLRLSAHAHILYLYYEAHRSWASCISVELKRINTTMLLICLHGRSSHRYQVYILCSQSSSLFNQMMGACIQTMSDLSVIGRVEMIATVKRQLFRGHLHIAAAD